VRPLASRDRRAKTFMSAFDFQRGPRPPIFLNTIRNPVAPIEPKRPVIYFAYGSALAIPLVLITVAFARMRRLAKAAA
jgi:phospholipase C